MAKYVFVSVAIAVSFSWIGACSINHDPTGPDKQVSVTCISDRDALLNMSLEQFDRTLGEGWRPIADKAGCKIVAADLISEYSSTRLDAENSNDRRSLAWHEGQLRAAAGQTDEALPLFALAHREKIDNDADVAWNLYVAATIAFLERDRAALDDAHRKLSALPEPDFWAAAVERTVEKYGFTPVWPSNLNVVEAFQRCFEKTYEEAYSQCNQGQKPAQN